MIATKAPTVTIPERLGLEYMLSQRRLAWELENGTDPAGGIPVAATLGNYTVIVEFKVSTLVEAVASVETASIIGAVEDWGVINYSK